MTRLCQQPLRAGSPRQRQGQHVEQRALDMLEAAGHRLLHRNFHCRFGEIDLITLHGQTLVFTEVRQRGSDSHGGAAHSVTPAKRRRLITTARHFLACHPDWLSRVIRFDVVTCDGRADTGRLTWLPAAFDTD